MASKLTFNFDSLSAVIVIGGRYGEGRVSGEAIDMRTRSIRRGSGHGTSEREALSSEIGCAGL